MKRDNGVRRKRVGTAGLAGLLLAGVALLAVAAFQKPVEEALQWQPMNAQVAEALAGAGGTGPPGADEAPADQGIAVTPEVGGVMEPGRGGQGEQERQGASPAAEPEDENWNAEPPPAYRLEDGKIDINAASIELLDTLPGIGEAKARAIVEERERNGPYVAVEDLLRVKGIGEKMLAKIKDSIVVNP